MSAEETNEVVIDNETGLEVVPEESAPTRAIKALETDLTRSKAERLISDAGKGIVKFRNSLAELKAGRAWLVTGCNDWKDFLNTYFGLSRRQGDNIVQIANIERATTPLLSSDAAARTLSRLSDESVQQLNGLEPETRVRVIERLTELDHTPTLLDVLQAIPHSLLTEKQLQRLDKLLGMNTESQPRGTQDWSDFVMYHYKRIKKSYEALMNPEAWEAVNYGSFDEMMQSYFGNTFGRIFDPDSYGYTWGYNPNEDEDENAEETEDEQEELFE